jgi:hypothetical protein
MGVLDPVASSAFASASRSIARHTFAFALGVYARRSRGRSVSPNPGLSCATTTAFNASASGAMVARSKLYAFAPNPCTHDTTVATSREDASFSSFASLFGARSL